jgi:hypothetical protein
LEDNRPKIADTISKEKNKAGVPALPNFRTYYKTAVIKTVWYWGEKDYLFFVEQIPF